MTLVWVGIDTLVVHGRCNGRYFVQSLGTSDSSFGFERWLSHESSTLVVSLSRFQERKVRQHPDPL